jgi:hypothetical protein
MLPAGAPRGRCPNYRSAELVGSQTFRGPLSRPGHHSVTMAGGASSGNRSSIATTSSSDQISRSRISVLACHCHGRSGAANAPVRRDWRRQAASRPTDRDARTLTRSPGARYEFQLKCSCEPGGGAAGRGRRRCGGKRGQLGDAAVRCPISVPTGDLISDVPVGRRDILHRLSAVDAVPVAVQ